MLAPHGEYELAILAFLDQHSITALDGTARRTLFYACGLKDKSNAVQAVKKLRVQGLIAEHLSDINGSADRIWRCDRPDAPPYTSRGDSNPLSLTVLIQGPRRARPSNHIAAMDVQVSPLAAPAVPPRTTASVAEAVDVAVGVRAVPSPAPSLAASIPLKPERAERLSKGDRYRAVLRWLIGQGGHTDGTVTALAIAKALGWKAHSVAPILEGLHDDGYINRQINGRRPISTTVTPSGYKLVGEASPAPALSVVPEPPAQRTAEEVLEWYERLLNERGPVAVTKLANFADMALRSPSEAARQYYLQYLERGLLELDPPVEAQATA
jgi:DNA-binding MarR family transcriptional regulator